MNDTPTKCEVCQVEFMGDGYIWTCQACRHPDRDCVCGSDDKILDWEIIFDQNGQLIYTPVWRVECVSCERRTVYCNTAKEAYAAWMNGDLFTPIGDTGHFEEVW